MPDSAVEIPFTMSHVLRTTTRHMRKSIDISIRKTHERSAQFADNPEKTLEIVKTLMRLHDMRKNLDDFQKLYQDEFKEVNRG